MSHNIIYRCIVELYTWNDIILLSQPSPINSIKNKNFGYSSIQQRYYKFFKNKKKFRNRTKNCSRVWYLKPKLHNCCVSTIWSQLKPMNFYYLDVFAKQDDVASPVWEAESQRTW